MQKKQQFRLLCDIWQAWQMLLQVNRHIFAIKTVKYNSMTGDLYINGKDAWTTWGVSMGEGFLDALDAPLQMKDYIENESRLENGKHIDTSNAKVASREITLQFTITGNSENDYRIKKKSFQAELQAGKFTVKVPVLGDEVFKLVYTGKSISYGLSLSRRFGRFSTKVTEPDPTDRT